MLDSVREKDIYIYGAGIKGSRLVTLFPDIQWKGYIDIAKEGQVHQGLKVYGLEKCTELKENGFFVISIQMNPEDIRETLISIGVHSEDIIVLEDYDSMNSKHIYFDDEIIKSMDINRVFADIGSFDGNDTVRYLDWCKNNKAQVCAFEADAENYKICERRLKEYNNVKVCNWGLGKKREMRSFRTLNTPSSRLSENGDVKVELRPLDEMDEEFGFIKMDVEGAEEEVLKGARRIISSQKPILAISIYHKVDDIWKLPQLILEMNTDYALFLRHYTVGVTGTVLYAIPRSVYH